MKYIKLYEVFAAEKPLSEYEDEVFPLIDTINDILLELSDENWDEQKDRFKFRVEAIGPIKSKDDKLGISLNIHRDSGFIRSDVYPIIDRITSYLNSEGYTKRGMDIFDGYNCNVIYRYGTGGRLLSKPS